MMTLIQIAAELRIVFKSLIPQLTDLVGDNEGSTRGYATLALSDFVEYGRSVSLNVAPS